MAAAALGEMWAARGNALRGGFQDFDQVGFDMAALLFPDPQTPCFARQDEGGENRLAIRQATEGFTAVDQRGGGEDNFLTKIHFSTSQAIGVLGGSTFFTAEQLC